MNQRTVTLAIETQSLGKTSKLKCETFILDEDTLLSLLGHTGFRFEEDSSTLEILIDVGGLKDQRVSTEVFDKLQDWLLEFTPIHGDCNRLALILGKLICRRDRLLSSTIEPRTYELLGRLFLLQGTVHTVNVVRMEQSRDVSKEFLEALVYDTIVSTIMP